MEHFILKDQHGNPKGLIPILEDDYNTALDKAKARAFKKVGPFTEITVYHRQQDTGSELLTPVLRVEN